MKKKEREITATMRANKQIRACGTTQRHERNEHNKMTKLPIMIVRKHQNLYDEQKSKKKQKSRTKQTNKNKQTMTNKRTQRRGPKY